MAELVTLPQYMRRNGQTMGDQPAMRMKYLGIWNTYNWSDYNEQVCDFAAGLSTLGFARGGKLGIIGNNMPQLYWAQMAAQSLGGMAVPVYQDSIAKELAYVLNHSEATVIVAEDQEQVDKILSIRDELPKLQHLVHCYDRGMSDYDVDILISYEDVRAAGKAFNSSNAGFMDGEISKGTGSEIALMCYTSGTTGNPKGVMLSHKNMLSAGEIFIANEGVRADDDFLSYLPMAWVGDTAYGPVISMLIGATCNCPEGPSTVMRDLRELGPTGIIAPPAVWEGMLSNLQLKGADAPPLKSSIFKYFIGVARQIEDLKAEGKSIPVGLSLADTIGEYLVFGPIRDQLGLRRARWCYSGGAPMGPDTFRFFRGLHINLKQGYGMTEVGGLVTLQPDGEASSDTVGRPCPGIDVRVVDDGEVQIKCDGIFAGYFQQDAQTAEVMTTDGWYRTGDAGVLNENGHLVIIDRAKDVGKLEDGTPYAPQFVELKMKFSPFVNEAVSFGDGHPFISAMVAIDFETVGKWAEGKGLPYTNYMDLSQKPEVVSLISDEVRKINQGLPEVSRIKRFLLLSKDLDADDNEITRTRKLRRGFIAEKYGPVIDAFYSGGKEVELQLAVTFEDGTEAHVDSRMTIQDAA
ncbi:MAG: AMP-binding protein [Rhodospirillaceae bacterium]|jgi:long-chain acyl-CoA synthetase|nr:AMP-binding protein [Rhodospirillaceae bacterium]MBT4691398.1 AMP-binding protein [Rhodospirillaceae bacterium]MBT5081454.1 AMP-binding protein [Rhodospirillaceae bacterium]MBT5522938.1 AMP-binding protein [Rhodospirillaceae bacterium]MBT5880827.1 AMP-binding protein [Rhodospirillaceae bacterium]